MPAKNKDTTVSFKINENVKNDANDLFNHLGLSMSSALKMFIHQSLIQHGIPFQAKDSNYDPITQVRVNTDIATFAKNKNAKRHNLID